jgi:hypothetical protein
MIFEQIEQLKRQYTDKYVIVDERRPELARFRGQTGTVKTVNMNGRALVEFDAAENIGWYDIALGFLTVIDAPLPKPEAKKATPKAEKTAAKVEKPAAAAKPAAKAGGSVSDILAAARGGAKPVAKAEAAPAAGEKKSVADILAAARGKASAAAAPAPAAKGEGKKASVTDILAAARGKAAPPAPAAAPTPEPAAAVEEPEPEAEAEPIVAAEPATAAAGGAKSKRGIITAVAEMAAYCRKTDAQS